MILYRFCQKKWVATAWSGVGAVNNSLARWNMPGTPMVYLASSVSLAMLEILVHVQDESILEWYQLMSIEIPDARIAKLDPHDLPANWNSEVPGRATKQIGSGWFSGASSVALMVPSAIVPMEYNALLNNQHPDFAACLKTVKMLDFAFDPRLTMP
ncbi:RES domain-containing protein [Erwinia toletana]|uniref:RES domain-containing protein n=1 Tax=Winslowiella toletana TaxID=92490 RepID=A0ABS4P3U7_9GAMM|nr:RES domain-containing protein [Winslowiella toletana]MBP2167316.1 RES domain-containing protein [Winslowiella toletana]